MKTDTIPETWEEKLSGYNIGEERVYKHATNRKIHIAKEAIKRANKSDVFFSLTATKTRFSIIRKR